MARTASAHLLACLAVGLTLSIPARAATIPAGFEESLVATVPAPTALAFTPDGRLLITSQLGQLYVYQNGVLLPTPALDLTAQICTELERGLLGIAVDPDFATSGHIFVYYTFKKSGSCPRHTAETPLTPVNRVSRFTLSTANTVSLASEVVLVDNIPSPNSNHNGGDLNFGKDGFLYISVGDGGCDYRGDSGCALLNDAARDLHALVGKILRITRSGGIPATNPFTGTGTARCNVIGRAEPGQRCQEVYATGLRNPWRMAFDPNASGTRFFINDVGQNTWEEVNEGRAGADYGWNIREGPCIAASATDCPPPPPGFTDPIFAYRHNGTCSAISGGAFVPTGAWPVQFEGAYLFSDYTCGIIFRLIRDANGVYQRTTFVSDLGESSAVAVRFGPHGGTQALYYTTYAAGGQVRRITPASGNRAPIAAATATPRSGAVPLAVRFDASGSSDPDGDALTFTWNFGDGSSAGTGAIVSHTYNGAGRFTATVTARDSRGATATASVTIDAGNTPPVPTISSPTTTARFAVDQTITLRGAASDAQDGALADARLSWTVLLHHDAHTHPFLGPISGNGLTFQAPAPEDLAATRTSFLEIRLTATDTQGASATTVRNFQPRLVDVTFNTVPAGLVVTVNGTTATGPHTFTSWEGYRLLASAGTQKDAGGQAWLFGSWADALGPASRTIVTPASAATYAARFLAASIKAAAADAYVRNGIHAATNFGASPELVVKHSATLDNQRQSFLRFSVGSGTVARAVLRLQGGLSSAGSVPVAAYPVANTTWSETGLTWNTRPARGTTALASNTVNSTARRFYEWDVTAYVRAERAAGRTAVGFALIPTVATSPYATFASRNAASNRPELLLAEQTVDPQPTGEIVLHAVDTAAFAGAYRLVADSTAADGLRISHPDAGAAKPATASAAATHWAEWSFTAEANRPYRLWIRGKADRDSYNNDSAFVQFSGSVTAAGAPTFRIGTTSSTTYVLEECGGCHPSGWGWQDNGYGAGVLGPLIYFATTGPQTIRIQTREDGLSIDHIVLSPDRWLTSAPGAVRNDATIVPR